MAGERMSIVCCHWALCSLVLPIAAAALDWEKPNEGKAWVILFISRCWGALLVAAGWPVVTNFGAPFPSLLLPQLCSTAWSWDNGSSLCTSPGERGLAAKWCYQCRDQWRGWWDVSDRLPLQIIESMSEIEVVFKLRVFVILLHLVRLGVMGGCGMVKN